jgi:hypothetical protein
VNKLIIVLIFFIIISPKVWGNENKNTIIDPINFLELYKKDKFSLGINVSPIESIWPECNAQSNTDLMQHNSNSIYCQSQYIETNRNIFVGFEISRKDPRNRFTISLQGGFNFGIRNEKREDGTQKIRVHANLESDYKAKFLWIFPIEGTYKISGRLVSPGSFPERYDSIYNQDMNTGHNKIDVDGLIFNKDPYITFRMTF